MTTVSKKAGPEYLRKHAFPECCGAEIVTTFTQGFYTKEAEAIREKAIKDNDLKVIVENPRGGLQQIILNTKQHDMYHKAVIANGFKMIRRFYNPNSHRWCYLYIQLFKQPKKRVKRAKVFG